MTQKKLILIGKKLGHSFSKQYFTNFFIKQGLIEWSYENFELDSVSLFDKIKNIQGLKGCNVTIPYKEDILPYLDEIDLQAAKIGAVNTIVVKEGKFIGYNTDQPAFQQTLTPLLNRINGALVLGTGGAAKAINFALKELEIPLLNIGRNTENNYQNFERGWLKTYNLIVNCTPLGMTPNLYSKPNIPYHVLTKENMLYDLVYNPTETMFLKEGKKRNLECLNGQAMLELQADLAFQLWTQK